MKAGYPARVLITGGREPGGVTSFAEGLQAGFTELGIPTEIVAASRMVWRWGELRDPRLLKILSTSAVLAAPFARRAVCMAHGFPCAMLQGWGAMLGIMASYWLANRSHGAQLVEVSEYSALHLRALFGLRVDAVIRNPVLPMFLKAGAETASGRDAITYVGRLHRSKNIDRVLPALSDVLDENPGLRAWIVGDGPMRGDLEKMTSGDKRIEFLGLLSPAQVRERLRRSLVFVSACPHEALGIAYIEALSQGCAVAMPASGGGLEIAPEMIGGRIQLFPVTVSHEGVATALRRALLVAPEMKPLTAYSPRSVAEAYLAADACFTARGTFQPEATR